jgi:hypothetical protein
MQTSAILAALDLVYQIFDTQFPYAMMSVVVGNSAHTTTRSLTPNVFGNMFGVKRTVEITSTTANIILPRIPNVLL